MIDANEAHVLKRLGRSALSLSVAHGFDFAVQFLLPVVLVRCLDPEAFGKYRLVWLLVGTALAFLPMALQATLYYFLPRSDAVRKRLYINQTLLFFTVTGLLAGVAVSELNPWLPAKLTGLASSPLVVPSFVVLWVAASLLDLLPTVEERIAWQAGAIVGLASLRAISLCAAAVLTGNLTAVLVTLLAFVTVKVGLLLWYVGRYHGLRGPFADVHALSEQLRLAAPFWAGGALFGLRAQADQWVAATLFPLHAFASFSIALVLGPLVNLCRQSVSSAFLPSMSRSQAEGSIPEMLRLNSHANAMTAALVFPMLAFAFLFAEDLIAVVYTEAHVDAAPVMRVYIVGLAALVMELASVMLLLRLGGFMLWLNLVALLLSTAVNWTCAQRFGLPGAALGSVLVIYIDRIASLWRISRKTRTPVLALQDWRGLAAPLLLSILAAALTAMIVPQWFAPSEHFPRALAGGLFLLCTYAAFRAACGMDRGLHQAVRNLAQRV